jgi:hypothetical protein
MALEPESKGPMSLVQKLVTETGITEAQARALVNYLGASWGSLVREAKFIKSQPQADRAFEA